jgi:4-amino-4-deoxy-L-arabinose transferase-like glycosyltransferase
MYCAVIFLILLFTFIASFAPVTGGIRNDEICLHLSITREWLNRGCIPVLPAAISYQAGNAHLLILLAGAMGSAAGQRLLSWLCFVLCISAIFIISRSFMDKNGALLAALIAAINPLVFRGAWVAFVDIQSSLFVLLPVVALLYYRRERQFGWIVLCSIFLGTGAGIKPTNFIYGAAFCGVSFLFALLQRVSWKQLCVAAACITLVGGALMLPWPVRTMTLTGSPVFPPPLILYKNGDLKPLGGGSAPYSYGEVKGYYNYVMSRYGDYRRSLVNFIKFPWDITMKPQRFQIGDSIGTLFLCILPCVFLFYPFARMIGYLLAMAAFSAAALYFLVVPEARYYIGVLMLLCPVLAATIQGLEKKKTLRFAVRTIIVINCIFSLMVSIRILGPHMKAAVDRTAAERMKRDNIPYYEAFDFLRRNSVMEVTVVSAPQNLYYLPRQTRYHVDPSLISHMYVMHGQYVLDMDHSQNLERDFALIRGDYAIPRSSLPPDAALVFQGPDARVYHLR